MAEPPEPLNIDDSYKTDEKSSPPPIPSRLTISLYLSALSESTLQASTSDSQHLECRQQIIPRHLIGPIISEPTLQAFTSDSQHLECRQQIIPRHTIESDYERQPFKSLIMVEPPEPLNIDDSSKSDEESSPRHLSRMPTSLETQQVSDSQHLECNQQDISRHFELDHERSDTMEKQSEALNGDDSFKSDKKLSFIKGPDTQTQRQADRNLSSSCSDHSDLSGYTWPKNEIVNIYTSSSASRTPPQCSQLSWNYTVENKELEKIKDSMEHIYNTTSSQFTETNKDVARVISTKQKLIPTNKTLSNTREDNLDFTNESDKPLTDYQETKEMNLQNRQKIDKASLFKAADNQVKNNYIEVKESMMDSTAYNYDSTANSSDPMLSNVQAETTEEEELMDSADISDIRSFRSTQLSRQIIESNYQRRRILKDYLQRISIFESSCPRIVKREDLLENKQPSKYDIMAEPPEPLNIDDSSDEKSFLRHLIMKMLTCLKTPQVSTSDPRHLESLLEKVIVLDDERQPSKSDTVAESPEPLNLDDSTKSEEESSLQHSIKMPTSLETPQASTSDFSAFERFLPHITLINQHMESLKKYVSELDHIRITLIIQHMESLKKCVAEKDHKRSDTMEKQPEALNGDDSFKSDQELSFIKGSDTQTQRQVERNLSSSCSDHSENEIVKIYTSSSASRTPPQCSLLSWNYTVENKELEKIKDSMEHIYNTTLSQFTETNKDVARVISTKQELIPTNKTLSNTREDNLDFTNESDKPLTDYQETKEMNLQNRQKIDKASLFKAADNQVKNNYIEVKESMMDSTAYNYDSTANSSDPMLSNVQVETTEEEELMDSADISDIRSFRSTQLSRQIIESNYQRRRILKDYLQRISIFESSSPRIVKREDLLENKQPFKLGIKAESPKPLNINDSSKFDENSSYRPKCFMIWRQLLEYRFPRPRQCTSASLQQNIRSHIIESDYKRSADDQVKSIQVEKSTEDSKIYNRDSTAISSASMPLDVQTKATEEEEFMDPVSDEWVPNALSNDTSLDNVFGTHWWATVIAKLKNFQNTTLKNFWKCFSKALCMFTIKRIYFIVLLILKLLLILSLSLSISLFLLYFRLDIYQNYKSINTITFPTAAVEIEKGILGQDQIVQVLTEYLERDSPLLKVVALIGNISDESYMVDLIKKKFPRSIDSDFSFYPNFIVVENLRVEHSTDLITYVKSFQKVFGNLQITILADFKVVQISDAFIRSIYLNQIINRVKDAFIQANISIKIIPYESLNKNALENTS